MYVALLYGRWSSPLCRAVLRKVKWPIRDVGEHDRIIEALIPNFIAVRCASCPVLNFLLFRQEWNSNNIAYYTLKKLYARGTIIWDILPCTSVEVNWRSPETSVALYRTTWHYNLGDPAVHSHLFEKPKSKKFYGFYRIRSFIIVFTTVCRCISSWDT